MNSKVPKSISERPGSSAREYEYENLNYDSVEKRSKIPIMPKRTYSLEGKTTLNSNRISNGKGKVSTMSMIPKLETKKPKQQNKNNSLKFSKEALVVKQTQAEGNRTKHPEMKKNLKENSRHSTENLKQSMKNLESKENMRNSPGNTKPATDNMEVASVYESPAATTELPFYSSSEISILNSESRICKDLKSFKDNVLKIPEYWTDAGETVTNILKNAIDIITKQYPGADLQYFEMDIQNILKATEAVKQQILSRIESIINKANQLYSDKNKTYSVSGEQDLQKITKKMEDLKNEVNYRKNVFGDLLKYGSEMRELLELEKSLKQRTLQRENLATVSLDTNKTEGVKGRGKFVDGRKRKPEITVAFGNNKKMEKHVLQSCGDSVRQTKFNSSADSKMETQSKRTQDDKTTQTIFSRKEELNEKENGLKDLNRQILELHELCKDHISKFKNFNLQIKMRGISSKSRHGTSTKGGQILHDQKMNEPEWSSSIPFCNKQKDEDVHQKEKLTNHQRKLLQVRDELIGMLKNRGDLVEGGRS